MPERGLDVGERAPPARHEQAPTLYRLFGDLRGLLDAVAEHELGRYFAAKQVRPATADPVEALRAGWDLHVEFGLANPAVYALMYGDLQAAATSRSGAAAANQQVLLDRIRRIAAAGRLRVHEDLAMQMVQAAGHGVVVTLLRTPEALREQSLSAATREAVIAAITTDPAASDPAGDAGVVTAANALRAALPAPSVLSEAEDHLLRDWLDRITRNAGQD